MNNDDLKTLAARDIWVLDVDDCLYDMACGLHGRIKSNIVNAFNDLAVNDPQAGVIVIKVQDLLKAQGITPPEAGKMTGPDLGHAFPPIVKALAETYPENLSANLDRFYGDDYGLITTDSDLVQAFALAAQKGIEIYIYTNGPSSPQANGNGHAQRVLLQRGFDQEAVERLRPRTYDLLMSIERGRGKPDPKSMQDFISHMKIDPRRALMADDGLKNLKTAKAFGMAALWTWTDNTEPAEQEIAAAQAMNAVRVRHTGSALLSIAQNYKG